MTQLGTYLKHLRQQKDRSRRWVERQSRHLFPQDKTRHISHSYLRQLEEGKVQQPSPLKLQTLAQIYGEDYRKSLEIAGYLEAQIAQGSILALLPSVAASTASWDETQAAVAQKAVAHLERQGIHSVYFLNSLQRLSSESLHIVSRLITTLSIQEERLKEWGAEKAGKKDDA